MSILNSALAATESYGQIRMDITIVVSAILILASIVLLIWLFFFFEKDFVTTNGVISENPVCTKDSNNNKNGTMIVKISGQQISGQQINIPISGSDCNYYKNSAGSKILVKYNKLDNTAVLVHDDPKHNFIVITTIVLIISIITFSYNYIFRNNTVAETISGATGITAAFRTMF